eukprot:Selendium_serpulae@DN6239_c0_g1_i2.p1
MMNPMMMPPAGAGPAAEPQAELMLGPNDLVIKGTSLAANRKILALCRICAAIAAGLAAGLLGLTGMAGALAFFLGSAFVSVAAFLELRTRGDPTTYFLTVKEIFTFSFFKGILPFIVFWTISYDVCYVF